MKKILLVILCIIACTLAFAACTPDEPDVHEHSWSTDWSSDGAEHWHVCTSDDCSEVNGKAAHSGGTATCTEKAKCATCGATYGELALHTYDKEVADAKFLATEATCTAKATYYKSCECGAKGTETFESGDLAEHTPAPAVDENVINPTCKADGSKDVVVYCSACSHEISRTNTTIVSTGDHNYDYADLVYKQEGEAQHSIKCNGCDTYSTPSDCTPANADNSCESAELCACGRELTAAQTHSYTGAPAWTAENGVYTATYACDHSGCTAAPKSYAISVPSAAGVASIVHIEDSSAFKFSITLSEGYYIVSVKNGDNALIAASGVYSAPISDSEITVTASNMYEIKFVDYDDTQIGDVLTLAYGSTVTLPADPIRQQNGSKVYTFAGWTPAVTAVAGNATYKATYTETTLMHTVTFFDYDGETVLQTLEVEHGKLPVYSGEALPELIWKDFVRASLSKDVWDKAVSAATEDTAYTAVYEDLYAFEIYGMRGDIVSTTPPTWGGCDFNISGSTVANIQKTEKFRVTITSAVSANADYRTHDSIIFEFRVNYDDIVFSTVDGTAFLTVAKNTTYKMAVDKTGKVYINGILLEGVVMSDGKIEFNITTIPDDHLYAYFEFTALTYDAEIKPEFESQIKDIYNSTGANGTKVVTPATNEEKLSYGVTQFTTFTAGAWQEQPLDSFDLTPYEVVKFYGQRVSGGSIRIAGLVFYCDPNVTEFKLVKNGAGYDLYVAGEKQDLGDTVLTNLNQFKINLGTTGNAFRYSDVLVDSASYVPKTSFTAVSGTVYNGATVVTSPTTTPSVDGLTGLEIYSYNSAAWGNTSLLDIDLLGYKEVKFYVISLTSNGSIRTNSDGSEAGLVVYLTDGAWKEIHLIRNAAGTGFDLYVNGTLSTVKFYTDSKKETEIPLTNLKQLALNQNSGQQFLLSNLFVDSESYKEPTPEPECTSHVDANGDEKCDNCGADVPAVTPDPDPDTSFTAVSGTVYNGATVVTSPTTTPSADGLTGLEIYSYTSAAWGNTSLLDIDLLGYKEVKFYVISLTSNGSIRTNSDGSEAGLVVYLTDGAWKEIHLVRNAAGTGFDLYVNGTLSTVKFYTDSKKETEIPLTNLKQLALNQNSGQQFLLSNLFVDSESYKEPTPEPECTSHVDANGDEKCDNCGADVPAVTPDPDPTPDPDTSFTAVSGTVYNGATVVASPTTTPSVDGLTGLEIYSYNSAAWGNTSLLDIDLLGYKEVKFYVISLTSNGSIRTNSDGGDTGLVVYLSDGAWKEIHLVRNEAGTGFDLYVNGTLSTVKFYTDSKKETEIPLTNLKQLALNQNSGQQFLLSNLFVDSESHKDPDPTPDPDITDIKLTIADDGKLSGEGVAEQTITLPTTRVWTITDANALTVTVALNSASVTAESLSVNGVAVGAEEVLVKINNILYLVGKPDYSTAGQVSFNIAHIQDGFYWNADGVVSFKGLTESDGVYTEGSMYNLAAKADSKITTEEGVAAYHANAQKLSGVWHDNWRLTLNKSGMNSISFYMTFNYNGGQLYAKDGIGDPTKLIHTFTANEVILVTIEKDGSVLIDGVDTGVDTSSDSFVLDFYNGGSANAYGSIGISANFWRYNKV